MDNENIVIDVDVASEETVVATEPEVPVNCATCGKMHVDRVAALEALVGAISIRDTFCDCNDVKPVAAPTKKKGR